MSVPKCMILVIALALLAGCASKSPLPEDELPNDFLFVFTYERLTNFGETVEFTADGELVEDGDDSGKPAEEAPEDGDDSGEPADEAPEVMEAPPPAEADDSDPAGADDVDSKPGDTKPKEGEETPGATELTPDAGEGIPGMASEEPGEGEKKPAGKDEESVIRTLPSFVKIAVDVIGRTDIEVTHILPRKNTSRQTITIDKDDLMELYQLIRAADIYNLPEEFEDGDAEKGIETYFVIGRNKPRTVTVSGTEVEALTRIKQYLLSLLPLPDLIDVAAAIERLVIMDRRTGVFYRPDEEAVKNIPMQYRKEYKNPWTALNEGGFPSPGFGPLPKDWN